MSNPSAKKLNKKSQIRDNHNGVYVCDLCIACMRVSAWD